MSSVKEKKILEYRVYNGVECMLVQWNDGTTTWTNTSKLSNKPMVCGFIRQCIELLRTKKREEEASKQKELEKTLLEKILKQNANRIVKVDDIEKKMIVNEICKKDAGIQHHEIFTGIRKYPQASHRPVVVPETKRERVEYVNRPKFEPVITPDMRSILYKPIIQMNICQVKFGEKLICEMSFCLDKNTPLMCINLEKCVFVHRSEIFTQLYYLCHFEPEKVQVVPADISKQFIVSDFEAFSKTLKEDGLVLLFKDGKSDYLLLYTGMDDRVVPFELPEKYVIFKVNSCKVFGKIFEVVTTQKDSFLWDDGTYNSAMVAEASFMFNKADILGGKPVFVVEDESTLTKHAINAIKQRTSVIKDANKGADLVVPSTLYDYIHQIIEVDQFESENRRVYGFKGFYISEILRDAYAFVVNEKFAQKCKMRLFLLFAVCILENNRNTILIEAGAYRILEKKAGGVQEDERVKPTKIITALKKYTYPSTAIPFYEEMKRKFGINFRNMVLLDELGAGMTLSDAFSLVNK